MACSYQGLALVTNFLGMFFMFKICVNGERERQIPLFDLVSLAFFFSLFFVLEEERHKI